MEDTDRSMVTGREAAFLLADPLPVREHARLVLTPGFAGPALRTAASLLYDEAAVCELAATVSSQPPMTPMTSALLAARIAAHGRLPWAATLRAYVALCADCVAVHRREGSRTEFVLEPPGAWSEGVAGRRLPTRRGTPGVLLWPSAPSPRL